MNIEVIKEINGSLTEKIKEWEKVKDISKLENFENIKDVYSNALEAKKIFSQLNTIIHATGILLYSSRILQKGEIIESMSLGAGNTNKDFDLVTNIRIAEFKFIEWKGRDSIRQNSLFCDFYKLYKYKTNKKKELYINDEDEVKKFLRGKRKVESLLSKNQELYKQFKEEFNNDYIEVGTFYDKFKDEVKIVGINSIVE